MQVENKKQDQPKKPNLFVRDNRITAHIWTNISYLIECSKTETRKKIHLFTKEF